jgi:hypothetical protein
MEPCTLPAVTVSARKAARRLAGPGLLLACLLAGGCVTSAGSLLPGHEEGPYNGICQVVATWKNEVVYAADPTHGGAPTPGIAGRVYLFGPVIDFPRPGDGSVTVELYDETPTTRREQAPLERWNIDRDTLKRLQRRDFCGWGYSLFLPWATYRPEITQVWLKLRYTPAKGTPLYAESSPLSLNGSTPGGVPVAGGPRPGVAPRAVASGPRPADGSGVVPTSGFAAGREAGR